MIKAYSKFLDILEKIQKIILTVSVPAMVLIMFYQVVMRYVFHNSPAWSEELVRYLFIFNVMMAAAIAVRRNSHLQIDILLNVLKPHVRRIFTICATTVGLVFLVLMILMAIFVPMFLVYLFILSLELVRSGAPNTSAGLGLPMSIPYTCVPIGTALMVLTSVEVILKNIQELADEKKGGTAV